MRDLPLFDSFTSLCKELAKRKDEHQSYFILEKNIYNSFTSTTNKLMVPCTYAMTNNRHSLVAETTKSSAVFLVMGELFIGANLVQIIYSEIEWSCPVARKENQINSQKSPKRENMLQFEQQIMNKRERKNVGTVILFICFRFNKIDYFSFYNFSLLINWKTS